MKIRQEISGIHIFDRYSGMHILLDEFQGLKQFTAAPRTVSIALTNVCDLHCYYCYAPKNNMELPVDFILSVAKILDELGTLEITLGGGEPLLYSHFIEICEWIWENTGLGISVTTNGHHLTSDIISNISGKISSIRFSIDGIEPRYSRIKGKPLSDLLATISRLDNRIPFGINAVVSPGQVSELRHIIKLGVNIGADNILIIPEHVNGDFKLSDDDWNELNIIIRENMLQIQLYVNYESREHIHVPYIDTESNGESLFAHISADKKLKANSFSKYEILIDNPDNLKQCLVEFNRRGGL